MAGFLIHPESSLVVLDTLFEDAFRSFFIESELNKQISHKRQKRFLIDFTVLMVRRECHKLHMRPIVDAVRDELCMKFCPLNNETAWAFP